MGFMCALNLLCVFILMRANKLCKFNALQVAGSGAHFLLVGGEIGESALTRRLDFMLSLFLCCLRQYGIWQQHSKRTLACQTQIHTSTPAGSGMSDTVD
jgi:hypothetical protein